VGSRAAAVWPVVVALVIARGEGAGRRPACRRVLGGCAEDGPGHVFLDFRNRRQRHGLARLFHQDRHRSVGGEGHASGEKFVGHDAQRVDVDRLVDRFPERLLRRHVLRCAGDHPGLGHVGGGFDHLGDAEVGEIHTARIVEQDVLRLHIAVDDPGAVGVVESLGHILEDARAFARSQSAVLDSLGERPPGNEAHGHPRCPGFGVDVVREDRNDLRMFETRDGLRLPTEALGERGVVEELGRQDLERHVAVERGLVGLEDAGHAPASHRFDDAIRTEVAASRERHLPGIYTRIHHPLPDIYHYRPQIGHTCFRMARLTRAIRALVEKWLI
jgi:hypothetical protein